jgi:hypothetical protein
MTIGTNGPCAGPVTTASVTKETVAAAATIAATRNAQTSAIDVCHLDSFKARPSRIALNG